MRYNNIDPCELYPGITIAREIPLATVPTEIRSIEGKASGSIIDREMQTGDYIVYLNIVGKNPEEVERMKHIVTAWARPMSIVPCEIVPTHWPQVAYDAVASSVTAQQKSWKHWIVCIVFRIFRGIAYDRIPTTAITDGAGELKINIGGTSYARPDFRLTAASASESITLYVDEQPYFRLVTPLGAGDIVSIGKNEQIGLYDASEDTTMDSADKVDFVLSDLYAMWEALMPGPHVIRAEPAASIEMEWRNEWV